MTVRELIERLKQFPDTCVVCVPNPDFDPNKKGSLDYTVALNVVQGCNEFDGIVFIDDYVEDDEDE
jgi:hypothetical protein